LIETYDDEYFTKEKKRLLEVRCIERMRSEG